MSRRAWPLGRTERPSSLAALVEADVATLRAWLRYSALSWLEAQDDGERASAFAPLVFAAVEPARQFAAWAAGLDIERRLRLERALAEVIEAWDPRMDAAAATLLVELAAYVGCAGDAAPVMDLLAKRIQGSDRERNNLAEAVAFFGRQRATPGEARMLAYRLWEGGLGAPTAAIVLLARAASEYGVGILEDLRKLAPDVVKNDPEAPQERVAALRRYTVNTMMDVLGAPLAYRIALQAQEKDAPELCDAFRRWRLTTKRDGDEMELHDRLTWKEYRVHVSDIDEEVLSSSASEELLDKLVELTSIDAFRRRVA